MTPDHRQRELAAQIAQTTFILPGTARASRRRREADAEYEQEILRGNRLGLTHREIAAAAEVAHGTVRAILARTETASGQPLPAPEAVSANGAGPDHG